MRFRGDAIFTNAATAHYKYIDEVLDDIYGKDIGQVQVNERGDDEEVNNPLNKNVRFGQPLRGAPSRQQRDK